MGFYVAAFRNIDRAAKKEFDYCWQNTDPAERIMQLGRAQAMANVCMAYFASTREADTVADVQWVGNRKSLSPSDVLVRFTSGHQCGLSCKSSRVKTDLTFKNMGVKHFKEHLGLDLRPIYESAAKAFCVQYSAPFKNTERKQFLRANTTLQAISTQIATGVLQHVTGLIYTQLTAKPQDWLRDYCLRSWMDYYTTIPWIRVTGSGKKAPYRAHVEDPHEQRLTSEYFSPQYYAMHNGALRVSRVTDQSIGIYAMLGRDEMPVFKIRAKYESEPLASSLKFLGDPL
jgi:hypothetical protein